MSKPVKFHSKTVGGDSTERYKHTETYILSKIKYSKLKSAESFLNTSIWCYNYFTNLMYFG